MKTDDLIKALAADTTRTPPAAATLLRVLPLGFAVSAILFALLLRVRGDILTALQTWRFDLKMALAIALAAASLWLVVRLARPTGDARLPRLAVLAVPVVLALAIVVEFVAVPASGWMPRAVGSNALWCLVSIPVLSLAPLAAILIALRDGAPRSPVAAGAAAGLMAGALGSAIYATHCWDDSPLFIGIWYPLGIAAVVVAGALLGRRLLSW